MRRLKLAAVLPVLALGVTIAHADPQLRLQAGADIITVDDNGVGDLLPTIAGSVLVSVVNFHGYNLTFDGGTSGPLTTAPYPHLDLTYNVTNFPGTPAPTDALHILWSDTGFHNFTGGFVFNMHNGGTVEGGSVTYNAYLDSSDAIFGEGTPLGSIGPFSSGSTVNTFAGDTSAFANVHAPYSATQEIVVSFSSNGAQITGDANLQAAPEPASVLLFGAALVGIVTGLRKKVLHS